MLPLIGKCKSSRSKRSKENEVETRENRYKMMFVLMATFL
jgi:hypothetical protein